MHVGRPLAPFWLPLANVYFPLAPFCLPFHSFRFILVPFWVPCALWLPFPLFWLAVGSLLLPFRSLLIQLSFVFFSLSLHFALSQSFECETCSTVLFYTTTRIDLFSFRLLLSLKKRICWNTCRTHPQIIVGTPIYRNRSLRALPNCNLFTFWFPLLSLVVQCLLRFALL